jgi:hypothetical protein
MNTRHLYTLQDGTVIVLEFVQNIDTVDPEDDNKFFYINLGGETIISAKDVEFEKYVLEPTFPNTGSSVVTRVLRKTTERAELIKALAAI